MGTRKGVGLFTARQAKQLDFLMNCTRRELNVSPTWFKFKAPGVRFTYQIECGCGLTATVDYARQAFGLVWEHLAHDVEVKATERDRTEAETRNATYPDRRRRAKPADIFLDEPPEEIPDGKEALRLGNGKYVIVSKGSAA